MYRISIANPRQKYMEKGKPLPGKTSQQKIKAKTRKRRWGKGENIERISNFSGLQFFLCHFVLQF